MKDVHVTPELLAALHRLELPGEVLFRLIWDHFQALCPTCKAAIEEWQAQTRGRDYDSAFEAVIAKADKAEANNTREKKRVERELREILRLDPAEALRRVEGARKRFRSLHLVEQLVDVAEQELLGDPRRSVELLTCARAIVQRPGEEAFPEVQVQVLLCFANALRASRRHRDAWQVFTQVRQAMTENPVIDYELYALRASFEGSFHRDRKNYEEAEKLFSQAILVYRVFGEEKSAAKNLLNLASIHHLRGDQSSAMEALHEAISILEPEEDRKLMAVAVQNLAHYRCVAGDPVGARRILSDHRELLERYVEEEGAEAFRLLIVWLEGRIARSLKEYDQAERKLVSAADGFSDLEIGYDTALVLLDLADSYLAAGNGEAVRKLVGEIEPLLSANDLDQEIIAALLLFQNAIEQDLVSSATVALVRKKIKKVGRRLRNLEDSL